MFGKFKTHTAICGSALYLAVKLCTTLELQPTGKHAWLSVTLVMHSGYVRSRVCCAEENQVLYTICWPEKPARVGQSTRCFPRSCFLSPLKNGSFGETKPLIICSWYEVAREKHDIPTRYKVWYKPTTHSGVHVQSSPATNGYTAHIRIQNSS